MRRVSESLPRIRVFVALRYTLIIAIAYLLLVEHEFSSPPTGLILLIVAALTSNVVMSRLPVRITNSTAFNASIILGDTAWITATLLYSGMFGADFFYLYFFVILLAAIGENLGLIVVGTIAVCTAYVYVLSASGGTSSLWSSPSLIRIPFLFTAAVFYGYLVDRVRHEQQHARAEADTVARLEHEISGRKRVESALRESEERYRKAVELSPDAIFVHSEGTIDYVNTAGGVLLGASDPEQLIGTPVMDIIHPDYREVVKERIQQRIDEGTVLPLIEEKFIRLDGTEVDVEVTAAAITYHDKVRVQAVIRDITERKRAEEELKVAQLQLMQSAKLESVGRLAAGVAHEVKNPLAIIRQGLAYLSHALSTTDDNTVAQVLGKMDNAVTRADRVVRGLLDFSAPTAVDVRTAELNAVLEQGLLLVKHELDRAHVTVVKALGVLPPLQLDQQKMEQVFVNLFMNAIQAMPDGGTLTIKTYSKPLTEFGPDGGRRKSDQFRIGETLIVLAVEDTGTGIPDEKLDRVFDPFFTTKPTGKGSGLGLTVTRKIVELHRGTIDIRNRHEGGVQVTLIFKTEGGRGDAEEADPAR
ncbi:MAG: PAS domain S-box protein [Nitrospirales bacterium]